MGLGSAVPVCDLNVLADDRSVHRVGTPSTKKTGDIRRGGMLRKNETTRSNHEPREVSPQELISVRLVDPCEIE